MVISGNHAVITCSSSCNVTSSFSTSAINDLNVPRSAAPSSASRARRAHESAASMRALTSSYCNIINQFISGMDNELISGIVHE